MMGVAETGVAPLAGRAEVVEVVEVGVEEGVGDGLVGAGGAFGSGAGVAGGL